MDEEDRMRFHYNRYLLCILIGLSLICSTGRVFPGTTGKIAGKVITQESKETLAGANVMIEGTVLGAAANLKGEYVILNVPPGTYTVIANFMGYKTEKITGVRVQIDKTTVLEFELQTEVLVGEEVVVTAYSPDVVEKELTATKQTYRMADVEQVAGVNDIADILELQADVVDNHFRGGREFETNYLVGGVSINNPLSNSRSFEPMVAALQEVEVITSGFSAEYGHAQSGVVNMIMKEGSDRWTARFDFSMDLPHYQTHAGNPYARENMPFFEKLSNAEEWLTPLKGDEGGITYAFEGKYGNYANDESHYSAINDPTLRSYLMHRDSLYIATMAMRSYQQMARDVGIQDDWMPRQRVDITAGGPISKNVRVFLAVSQRKTKDTTPTPHPDLLRQLMGNLTTQLSGKDKLTTSYSYNYRFRNGSVGLEDLFDRVLSVEKREQTSHQLAMKWNHIFNSSSYLELGLKYLNTYDEERPEFLDDGRFEDLDAHNGSRYTENNYVGDYRNNPAHISMNRLDDDRGYERTHTYGLTGFWVSQINSSNLIKFGVQLQGYHLDVYNEHNASSPGEMSTEDFTVDPYEGAVYIQDKLEWEGMIANFGLRYDFYNYNFNYFSNIFTPLLNPHFPEKGSIYDPEYAEKEKTKSYGRLQPRLGVSFPISDKSVFHLNYGTFIQRPGFNEILYMRFNPLGLIDNIGNPLLKPERTSAYDVGIVQSLPFGLRLDVSAFYKDVQDLTEEAIYVNKGNEQYFNRTNRDYADIKGFNVNLEKTTGYVNTYLRYNYQSAKGKASESGDARIVLYETPQSDGTTIDLPNPRDIFMDYDRKHRLIASMTVRTGRRTGPAIMKFRPLADMSLSATFTYMTGRPYTYDVELLGLVNNKRQPSFNDLRMRLQKSFQIGQFRYMIYIEGFNILNSKEWDQDVFDLGSDLWKRWVRGDRESLLWFDPRYEESASNAYEAIYQINRAFQIYSNQPRYFRAGVRVDM